MACSLRRRDCRRGLRVPLFLPLTLLATALPAQWTPRPQAPAPTPSARAAAGLAFHTAQQAMLLFGGQDGQNQPLGDTWKHDGQRWWRENGLAPQPRWATAIAYVPSRTSAILFGGRDATTTRNDTWEYSVLGWRQAAPATTPPARSGHLLVHDPQRDRTVLFGGLDASGSPLGDTWEYDGLTWTQRVLPVVPTARSRMAAAHDPLRRHVLLFGGLLGNGSASAELWAFDGTDWRELGASLTPQPIARHGAGAAFDPDLGHFLLFGGADAVGTPLGGGWRFDGAAWSALGSPAPSPRQDAAMAFDPQRHRALLFGGRRPASSDETWTLHQNPRPYAARFGPGCNNRSLIPVNDGTPELGGIFVLDHGAPLQPALVFAVLGLSSLQSLGQPLPRPLPVPNLSCLQLVDPAVSVLVPLGPSGHRLFLPVPAQSSLLGAELLLQGVDFSTQGTALLVHTSNAVEARLGVSPTVQLTTENFATALRRDPDRSSGTWGNGALSPGLLGGDGRHGSFDPSLGTPIGPNEWEWNTDHALIPADRTLTGVAELVTDGRFHFTDFVIPAGVTVRFTGSQPLLLYVRGRAAIDGTLDASGATMGAFTVRDLTNNNPGSILPGQPGGRPGPGGGAGGAGGDRCNGQGPRIVAGINTNDGQPGQDVRVRAGHAYLAQTFRTGGAGSAMFPPTGVNGAVTYTVSFAFNGQIAPGGSGGGFGGPGGVATVTMLPPGGSTGPAAGPSNAFALLPLPAGARSLDHFLVGGAGGGGGGSHPFLAITGQFSDVWRAGAGGSGGGGAVAVRAGSQIDLTGTLAVRGGDGRLFSDRPSGIPSPGGGGSGGSVLLQSIVINHTGSLDARGGAGGSIAGIQPVNLSAIVNGGSGAPGRLRLESLFPTMPTGNSVPTLTGSDVVLLADSDARVGDGSVFVRLGGAPTLALRYELDAIVNGSPVRFSDDPAVGPPATDPNGALVVRFQAGRSDGMGGVVAAGPWRAAFGVDGGAADHVSRDAGTHVRWDIVFHRTAATATVTGLRLYWR